MVKGKQYIMIQLCLVLHTSHQTFSKGNYRDTLYLYIMCATAKANLFSEAESIVHWENFQWGAIWIRHGCDLFKPLLLSQLTLSLKRNVKVRVFSKNGLIILDEENLSNKTGIQNYFHKFKIQSKKSIRQTLVNESMWWYTQENSKIQRQHGE